MGFREIVSLETDSTTAIGGFDKKAGKPNPTEIVGYYLGSEEKPSERAKSGKCWLHILKTPKGNVGVWGKTDLDRKIKNMVNEVGAGYLIRITQTGTLPCKGKNDMYLYKVGVDDTQRIDVPGGTQLPLVTSENEGSNYGNSEPSYSEEPEETDLDAEETQPDEITPPRAQAPRSPAKAVDPARAAKVAAALGRRA